MADISTSFGFGDIVSIKRTAGTVQAGIAGLKGTVYGFTTPSVSGIEASGPLAGDFALNVYIDSLSRDFWLYPDSIELIERPETMEFSVGGKTIRVSQKDGEYKEELIRNRPWWKFW